MTRYIYAGGGDGEVVGPSGLPRALAPATVMSARTGGSTVTDIQDMSGASLSGVVTTDAYGQAIFQGPDGYRDVLWLDFGAGTGPRWAVAPKDTKLVANDLIAAWAAASPTLTTPTINGSTVRPTATGNIAQVINGLLGQTGKLTSWQVNGVEKAYLDAAGNISATNYTGTVQTYTPVLSASTTSPTLGTGSASVGRWVQFGKMVYFMADILFGSSGFAGGSGNYRISLPVAADTTLLYLNVKARYNCAGTTGYVGEIDPNLVSSTVATLQYLAQASARLTTVTPTVPGTFANNDRIRVAGNYLAA